ncbi:MAG: hypothetical protein ACOZCO_12740 [Bacteroidota bacterium]
MKKTLLYIFTFLLTVPLMAQVKPPYKTTIGEKEYWVYPFRIEDGSEMQVPPVTLALPDGDYILYYDFKYKTRFNPITWKWKDIPVDSTNIAALFTIKNGMKEGECKWYLNSAKKILYSKGNYYKDEKYGAWSFYGYYNGKIYLRDKFTYEKDEYHGPHTSYYYGTAQIASEGMYKNGRMSGTWKFYSGNTVWRQYSYADSSVFQPSIYDKMLNTLISETGLSTYNIRFYEQNKTYVLHGECFETQLGSEKKTRLVFDRGNLVYMDTVFDWAGKADFIIKKLQPELHDTVSEFFIVNRMSWPYFHARMKNNTLIYRMDFREIVNSTVCDTTAEHYYYSDEITSADTLVPFEKSHYYVRHHKKRKVKIKQYNVKYIHYPTQLEFYGNSEDLKSRIKYDAGNDQLTMKNEYTSHGNRMKSEFITVYERDSAAENRMRNEKRRQYYNYEKERKLFIDNEPINGNVIYPEGKFKRDKQNKIEKQGDSWIIYPVTFYNKRKITEEFTDKGAYRNGVKQGEWQRTKKGVLYELDNYNEGEYHGKQYAWRDKHVFRYERDEAEACGINEKEFRYLASVNEYKNGMLNGDQYQFNYKGELTTFEQFKTGLRHGVYETFHYKGMPLLYAEFKNGWYDGKFIKYEWEDQAVYDEKFRFVEYDYYKSKVTLAQFKDGWLDGEFRLYEGGTSENDPPLTRIGSAKNGVKTGDWMFYYDEEFSKQVKEKTTHALSDSCYFYYKDNFTRRKKQSGFMLPLGGEYNEEYRDYQSDYEPEGYNDYPGKTGYYTSYLKNGNKNMEGRIEDNVRVGAWKFYDEGGTLVKEVNYSPDKFLFTNAKGEKDSVMHYGTYKSWYYNGKLQSEGFILNEGTKYDCYAELNIPEHELLIIHAWDIKGIQLVKDGNGSIQFTDPNGVVICEGKLSGYKRNGVWRFYAPDKTLTEIGNYADGKKHGKWLSGDLEGMNFQDEACFDTDSPFMVQQMEYAKKEISIQEKIYENDKLIRMQDYEMNLNKEYKDQGRFRLFRPRRTTYTPVGNPIF